MFLNKIELDLNKTKTILALKNPNLIHGALASNFPGEKFLWRIDTLGSVRNLLILSERELSLEPIQNQFGKEEIPAGRVDYSPVLERAVDGSCWKFRIKANPVRRAVNEKTLKSSYFHYMNDADRLEWLKSRAEKNGFDVVKADIRSCETLRFYRQNRMITLSCVTFEGILKVIDEEKFRTILEKGLGHGKAYGLGLMSLARL